MIIIDSYIEPYSDCLNLKHRERCLAEEILQVLVIAKLCCEFVLIKKRGFYL